MASVPFLALSFGLCAEVLALRNHGNLVLKCLATLSSIAYLTLFITYKPPGTFATVWPLGMNIYCLAQRCWNHIWLRHSNEFAKRRDKENGHLSGSEGASSRSRLSLQEALDAALTFRGVGWSFEAKGIPKFTESQQAHIVFVLKQLKAAVLQFLILDIAVTYFNSNYPSLDSTSVAVKLQLGALMLLYVRWTMDIPYRMISVFAVLSGASEQSDWPPLFGSWQDAFTIRRFWSNTWHQGMRLLAEPPMDYLTHSWLELPRGSYASKWVKFYGNFTIACADHAYGRIIAGGNPMSDCLFFIVQPTAIWAEETLRSALVRYGWLHEKESSTVERWLGYVWTAAFESWTFLYFMEGVIRNQGNVPATTLIEPPFGVSLCGRFLK